jgi:hypothetical protein
VHAVSFTLPAEATTMASNTAAQARNIQVQEQDDGGAGTPVKRARLIQPDVTVVVGGTEFHHFSQILCNVSDYFDGILNSGKPSTRLEFPEKDAGEWEMLLPVFSVAPSTSHLEITKANVEKIAEWSLLLGIDWLREKCDNFYSTKIILTPSHKYRHHDAIGRRIKCPSSSSNEIEECEMDERGIVKCLGIEMADPNASAVKVELQSMIEKLQFSIELGMSASKKSAARHVRNMILNFPEVFDEHMMSSLISVINGDLDTIDEVWESLKPFVPDILNSVDPPSLCCNAIFPNVFSAQLAQTIISRKKERQLVELQEEKEKQLVELKEAVLDLPQKLYSRLPAKRNVPKKYTNRRQRSMTSEGTRCDELSLIIRSFVASSTFQGTGSPTRNMQEMRNETAVMVLPPVYAMA